MPFDPFKPDTWFQQDERQTAADSNAPKDGKSGLVICPVHGDMVTPEVADAHVAAEEERKQREIEEKAAAEAKAKEEADKKAAEAPQGYLNPEQQAQQETQRKVEEQRQQEATTAQQRQSILESDQKAGIQKQLQDMWLAVATPNERYNATIEPALNVVTKDMVTNNPLELKLGDMVVRATTEDEMSDLLRYITDNRGYLPTGGTPLGGTGTMSAADYKLSVENEKSLDTPERQAYQYWQMQQDRVLRYSDDQAKLAEILEGENSRRVAAGLDEISVSQLKGIGAVYADRVARRAGRIAADEEIQARLTKARDNYAASITERVSDTGWSMRFNEEGTQEFTLPNGWAASFGADSYYKDENGRRYPPAEIAADPELMRRFSEAITPQMVEQFKKEAQNQPEVVENLISRISDSPVSYALLTKAYPELAQEGVITDYLGVLQKQGKPAGPAMPMQLQDVIDSVGKVYQENPTFIQAATTFLSDTSKPDALKTFALAVAKDAADPTGSMRMFEVLHGIWVRGVSAGWRDVPYDEWQEKTIKEATGGATPAMRVGIGAGAASLMANSDIQLGHLVAEWTDPQFWIAGGEARAEGEVAVKILKGAEANAIKDAAEIAAKETGRTADEIITKAENRINKAVESVAAPDNIIVPETKPAVGQVFDANVTKDAAGNLVKNEDVPYRAIKEGETIPADAIEQNGKIYVKEIPAEGTQIPKEGKTAQAAMDMGKVETTTELQSKMREKYPDATPEQIEQAVKAQEAKAARTPAMAEIDTEIVAKKTKLKESYAATKQMNIVYDPKVQAEQQAEFYKDLVDLAGLYIKKGIKTVEEFARELEMKVTPALRHAWDAAKGDQTKATYEALSDNLKGEVNSSLKQAQTEVMLNTVIDEIGRVKALQPQDIEALKQLRAQQGAGIRQAKAMGLKGEDLLRAELSGMKGQKEKVIYEPLDLPQNVKDNILDHVDTVPFGDDFSGVRTKVAMEKIFKGEMPQEGELELLEYAYGREFIDGLIEKVPEIAKLEKETIADFLTKVYYNSLITIKSNIPNTVGNAIASFLSPFERGAAATVEAVARQGERKIFFGETPAEIAGLWTGIPEGARAWLNAFKGQGTETLLKGEAVSTAKVSLIENVAKGEKGKKVAKLADSAIKFNTDLLNATDQFFKAVNYHAALNAEAYRMAAKEGLKGDAMMARYRDLISKPSKELNDKALKIAKEKLFQKQSNLVDSIIKIRDWEAPKTGGLQPFRILIPFVRTPVNLVKFGLQRSPLGLLDYRMWIDLAKKDPQGAENLGKALIGTGIATALFLYARDGLITGPTPNDTAGRDEFYRQGKLPYAVKIGDKWISYQRLEPFNQIFLQVANAVEASNNDKDFTEKAGTAFNSTIENLASQNFLYSIGLAMNAIRDPDRYGAQFVEQTVSSMVPFSGTLRQVAQLADTTIRSPQNLGEQVMAGTPGLSQNVAPKVNTMGEVQQRETPAWLPYQFSTEKNDPITMGLVDKDVTPGYAGKTVGGIKLSDAEHQEYMQLTGELIKKNLGKTINGSGYKSAGNDRQKELLESAIERGRAEAKKQWLRKK